MKYTLGRPRSCKELSEQLGVAVTSITEYPDGGVEVETAQALDAAKQAALSQLYRLPIITGKATEEGAL